MAVRPQVRVPMVTREQRSFGVEGPGHLADGLLFRAEGGVNMVDGYHVTVGVGPEPDLEFLAWVQLRQFLQNIHTP